MKLNEYYARQTNNEVDQTSENWIQREKQINLPPAHLIDNPHPI